MMEEDFRRQSRGMHPGFQATLQLSSQSPATPKTPPPAADPPPPLSNNPLSIRHPLFLLSSPLQQIRTLFVSDPENKKIPLWPVICMGVTTAWSGQFFYWCEGLQAGFWIFLASFLFVSSGMLALVMCLAEINSCLPFSGGSYGFSRITSTAFIAYVTGVCERINLTAGLIRMISLVSSLFIRIFLIDIYYEILLWFILSAIVLFVYCRYFKAHLLWQYFRVVMVLVFGLLCVVIGCLARGSQSPGSGRLPHRDDLSSDISTAVLHTFTDCLPLIFLFYHGIETIPFAASDLYEARKNLPKALLASFIILFVTAIILMCLMTSVPDDYRENTDSLPSSSSASSILRGIFMFSSILHHYLQIPDFAVNILYLIPCLGALFGFYYAANRLLYAMSQSRLFLIGVHQKFEPFDVHNLVNTVTIITALVAMIIGIFVIQDLFWISYALSLYSFIISQLCNLSSFIIFRRKYMSLHREFNSPFGMFGAFYAMFVLVVMFVAMLMRDQDRVIVLPALAILMILFYVIYRQVQFHQIFSREEETILFLAHVMKANMARRLKYTSRQSFKTTNYNINNNNNDSSKSSVAPTRVTHRSTRTNRSFDSPTSPVNKSYYSTQSSANATITNDQPSESNNNNNKEEEEEEPQLHLQLQLQQPASSTSGALLNVFSNDSHASGTSRRPSFLLSSVAREPIPEESIQEMLGEQSADLLLEPNAPMRVISTSNESMTRQVPYGMNTIETPLKDRDHGRDMTAELKIPSSSSLILSSPRHSEEGGRVASALTFAPDLFNVILEQSALLQTNKEKAPRFSDHDSDGGESTNFNWFPSRSHSTDPDGPITTPAKQVPKPAKRGILQSSYLLLRQSIANSSKVIPANIPTSENNEDAPASFRSKDGSLTKMSDTGHLDSRALSSTEINDGEGDDVESQMQSLPESKQIPGKRKGSNFLTSPLGGTLLPPMSDHLQFPRHAATAARSAHHMRPGSLNFSYIFDRIANSESLDELGATADRNGSEQGGGGSVSGGGGGGGSSGGGMMMNENEYIKMISDKFAARRVVLDDYILKKSRSRDPYGSSDVAMDHLSLASRVGGGGGVGPHNTRNNSNEIGMRTPLQFSNTIKREEKYLVPETPQLGLTSPNVMALKSSTLKPRLSSSTDSDERRRRFVKQSPPTAEFFRPEDHREEALTSTVGDEPPDNTKHSQVDEDI